MGHYFNLYVASIVCSVGLSRKESERAISCADRALALSPNLEAAQKLIVSV